MYYSFLSPYLMVEHMMNILVLIILGGGTFGLFQEGYARWRDYWKLKIFI